MTVIFYNVYFIVSLLSLLPCLWDILLGEKSLSGNDQLSFHNPYNIFGLQAKTPDLHFRVGSKHHNKHGSHVLKQRKLMSCLLQPFFQVFIHKFVCLIASRPVSWHSYLSNMMLCNNFSEHFQMLYNWLKISHDYFLYI